MTDFSAFPPPLSLTEVLPTTILSNVTPVSSAAVPIGSGKAPYENYATGVDFVVTPIENSAIGNLTVSFQASFDNATWFTVTAATWVGAVISGVPIRFNLPVGSRQWRLVRCQCLAGTAQTPASESTVRIRAQSTGIQVPFTKTLPA